MFNEKQCFELQCMYEDSFVEYFSKRLKDIKEEEETFAFFTAAMKVNLMLFAGMMRKSFGFSKECVKNGYNDITELSKIKLEKMLEDEHLFY